MVTCRKKKKEIDRKVLQKRLGNVTKLAKSTLINYDAYLLADAERKNLNLSKFREQIKANMSDDSDEDETTEKTLGNDGHVYFCDTFPHYLSISEKCDRLLSCTVFNTFILIGDHYSLFQNP